MADLPLTYLHVFSYSQRAGTPAERLPEHQDAAVKKERAQALIALGAAKRLAFHQRFVGRSLQALAEGRSDSATGLQVGLSDNYIKVLFSGPAEPNEFVEVQIEQAREELTFGVRQ